VRAEFHDVRAVFQEIEANALRRVDLAMQAFFRRCKTGAIPGFPRFKAKHRYDSFEYPHGNRCIKVDREVHTVTLPSVGPIRFRDARGVPPSFTVVKIMRKLGAWYACFETVIEPKAYLPSNREIGVDVGVANLAVTSDGVFLENPRYGQRYRVRVERHQQALSRTKHGSKRRRKAIRVLARAKSREADARIDTAHKASRKLAECADVIVFEDLRIANMVRSAKGTIEEPGKNVAAKSGLNRVILDAAWRRLMDMTVYKAEEAGGVVAFVNAKNTSRTCSGCGHVSKHNRLTQAEFLCVGCGHAEHADVNAAKNILGRYRGWLGLAPAA